MKTQATKAAEFAALHEAGCFVIPNPWDVGSARILAGLGFAALTTTSAGFARSAGVPDYNVTRDQVMAHVRELSAATDLPLAADLENGFGPNPEDCAETIRQGAAAGLVGGSIEDSSGQAADPILGFDLAVERIRAAAEAARGLPFKFMLVARAENYLYGRGDLGDTIRRLQAYQAAGADVLYAPGLATAEDIRTVCAEVDRPVNVLCGFGGATHSVAALAELGVRRISLGSWLHSLAMTALVDAAKAMQAGNFGFTGTVLAGSELNRLLKTGAAG